MKRVIGHGGCGEVLLEECEQHTGPPRLRAVNNVAKYTVDYKRELYAMAVLTKACCYPFAVCS